MKNGMVLEFEVKNQLIKRKDIFNPVEKSENYLYVHFTFSNEWVGLNKIITFMNSQEAISLYLDENNSCVVPNLINKSNGFNLSLNGKNEENNILITTGKLFVRILEGGTTQFHDSYIRYVNSETLECKKNDEILNIEIPNIYGVKLKLIEETGIIQLLGSNENVLNEIDLPTEKIITNIYYNEELKSLIFQFENHEDIEVPIGDIFNLDNYYNKTTIDVKINNVNNNLNLHTSNTNNPHNITASQVGAYNKEEVDTKIEEINSTLGDIASILDMLNGEVL